FGQSQVGQPMPRSPSRSQSSSESRGEPMILSARSTALPNGTNPGLPPLSARIIRRSHSSLSKMLGLPESASISTGLICVTANAGAVPPVGVTVNPSTNAFGQVMLDDHDVVPGASCGSIG